MLRLDKEVGIGLTRTVGLGELGDFIGRTTLLTGARRAICNVGSDIKHQVL